MNAVNVQQLAAAARPQHRLALRGARPARVGVSCRRSAASHVVCAFSGLTSKARPSSAELARTAVDISTDGTLYIVGSDGWPMGAHASYVLDASGQPVIQAPANAAYRSGLEKDNVKCSLFVQVSNFRLRSCSGSTVWKALRRLTRASPAPSRLPCLGRSSTERASRARASPRAQRLRRWQLRSSARCATVPLDTAALGPRSRCMPDRALVTRCPRAEEGADPPRREALPLQCREGSSLRRPRRGARLSAPPNFLSCPGSVRCLSLTALSLPPQDAAPEHVTGDEYRGAEPDLLRRYAPAIVRQINEVRGDDAGPGDDRTLRARRSPPPASRRESTGAHRRRRALRCRRGRGGRPGGRDVLGRQGGL